MRLRRLALVAVLVALLAAGCSSGQPSSHGAAGATASQGPQVSYWTKSALLRATPLRGDENKQLPAPGQSAQAQPADVTPRVGALFVHEPGGNHFCTASAVSSPARDLLITAAHCINGGKNGGYREDIVFIPGYHDGQEPYGVWTVRKLLVASGWDDASDPALDVGFVVLNSRDGKNIEDVLGANTLGIDSGYQHLVRVTGYPSSDDKPIMCFTWTARQSASQLRLACAGFTGGTSGSPWITHFDPQTRDGAIVGVIGGYQEGGNTAAVSYSSYLGPAVARLYDDAVKAGSAGG
jgi:V8-like Glu-specific endopeptidase